MKLSKINSFTKGWFIGNFSPTLFSTDDFEIAIKSYKKGESECAHFHKIAKEITCVLEGKVMMNDCVFTKGDILEVEAGEVIKFVSLTKSKTLVVKIPCAKNDKYIVGEKNDIHCSSGKYKRANKRKRKLS